MTTPAALAAPQPRARRSVTYGASVAARISPRMIDAATVASCPAIAEQDHAQRERDQHPPTDRGQAHQPAGHQRV